MKITATMASIFAIAASYPAFAADFTVEISGTVPIVCSLNSGSGGGNSISLGDLSTSDGFGSGGSGNVGIGFTCNGNHTISLTGPAELDLVGGEEVIPFNASFGGAQIGPNLLPVPSIDVEGSATYTGTDLVVSTTQVVASEFEAGTYEGSLTVEVTPNP